ncbi:MAG: DUF1080 domain-containing protein [Dysgonomonas sp.]|nr:DUF1080 domain-containing protein [Dysgonomonas sp.]
MKTRKILVIIFCVTFVITSTSWQTSELESKKRFKLSKQEKREGFKILFDGSNMDEWTGNLKEYVQEEDYIVMRPAKEQGGNLYSKDEFENFILRFEFQLPPEGNNGLGIRHTIVERGYSGMELQILDNEHPSYKDLKPWQYHGSVYAHIPAKRGAMRPAGEWNFQEVIANGNNLKITLNGVVILDCNLVEDTKYMEDKDIDRTIFNKKGHLAFLGHGYPVKFKNIRIKELK